ncbi:Six-bladed beta-propeller, TolB-like,Major royal jelly protein/protein yellow [Cinara cedri]|uniref:Six-bladed beta-propeller, TolB-like,Major royal jelly protein/protein yellow n=1 Tax=Cinara cedri TaxID=506608 RepID=A0A5E4MZ44_9HEMI|nr:Six-bladed beta-propeller, TolB-like,Major royal jelly protein/protein yellow [Cinara cedri]
MELYFGLCVLLCLADIYVFSQNITCVSSICKPYMLNGHYVKWPSPKVEADYLTKKNYIPKNIIFTRLQTCGNQVFLVSPRYKEGVPFTLSHLKLTGKDQCYNYVRPYPTLEKSLVGDHKSIVNAIDIYMGQNGILWVLDIGVINTLEEKPKRECEAKILGIESDSGRIIHTILLRSLICRVRSRLQYLVVEYISNDRPIIYIGDGGTRSIIVWNVKANEGYRVKLPRSSTTTCTDSTMDDVFYLALIENSNITYIYFTYLSSSDMFKVRTKDLRRKINPKCVVDVGRKPCKMILLGSAYGTVIYFRIKGLNNLYSWDTKESLLEENVMLVKKSTDCRTITHIDVDNNGVLWELESNIEDFVVNTVGCYGASIILAPIFRQPAPLQSS